MNSLKGNVYDITVQHVTSLGCTEHGLLRCYEDGYEAAEQALSRKTDGFLYEICRIRLLEVTKDGWISKGVTDNTACLSKTL